MNRHEWGEIHFYLGLSLLALILIHLILHWSWIKNYLKGLGDGRSKTFSAVVILFACLVLIVAVLPFLL